jgi:hypothetical protein
MDKVAIKKNDKFVCSWGYDQTQYSVYNVVDVRGKFVFVEGTNSWSHFSESDLAVGSEVKVYTFTRWEQLTDGERADYTSPGFDWSSYQHHMKKDASEKAPVRKIIDMRRIDGDKYTYIWTLDNGEIVNSKENYERSRVIEIVRGLKRCLVSISKYNNQAGIRIDQVIYAHHDPDYGNNAKKYAEQNEYTAYNGR